MIALCFTLQLISHHRLQSPPLFFFLFYFRGGLRSSFFINREELVGSVVLLIFFLFLFLGCNWGKAFFSAQVTAQSLNSPHTPFSHLAPPKPDVSHCFGICSPHSALFHIWHMYILLPSFLPLLLNLLKSTFNIFSPFAPTRSPTQPFFSSLPSFSTSPPLLSPSFVLPHRLHSPLRLGGESALPAEQHWRGGQCHVPTLCQPSYCISLWGWHFGQETPSQDRTGSQAYVKGKVGESCKC